MIISAVLAVLASIIYLLNPTIENVLHFALEQNIFGDQQITLFVGLSPLAT